MKNNPLLKLATYGQSLWLDFISRDLINSSKLNHLVSEDELKGLTSNPAIFEKAISHSTDYDEAIKALVDSGIGDENKIYEKLAIKDIKDAADILLPVYYQSKGIDGYACFEVSPHLAFDTLATIQEARRLWQEINKPNLMIKVPGTKEAMPAITELIKSGINVNVTLLFSVSSYKDCAHAYLAGLKARVDQGLDINNIHSVASFFVSRIDSKVDELLKAKNDTSLLGKIAIANAKVAYLAYEEIYQTKLFKDLQKKGAHPQRLLWASTGTKNKEYSDVLYVEALIGQNTINTLPPETMAAFKDHGQASSSLSNELNQAPLYLEKLKKLNIDFAQVCEDLLSEGLKLFSDAFDKLILSIKKKSS